MKILAKAFVFTLACSMAIVSCKSSSQKSNDNDTINVEVTNFDVNQIIKKAYKGFKCVGDTTFGTGVTVYSEAHATIQWLTKFGNNTDLKALQDSIISSAFLLNTSNVDSALIEFVAHPQGFKDYKLEEVDSIPAADENARILSDNINARIVELNERFAVYKIEYDSYSGGAHPSYAAKYINYDAKENKVLTFNTIFKAGNDSAIFNIVKSNLFDQFFAKDLKELEEKSGIFTEQIFLSHNVAISSDGIKFFYNPYEIGPWAIGVVEVTVPEYELTDFLTNEVLDIYKIQY
ncbi:MAG: RsiV family protein [Muribaculaceae bacterium]|nr:RsiV family protein [Muribaculaceae bacterium]